MYCSKKSSSCNNLFNALMNSSVVWFGIDWILIALIKLHVERSLCSFFSLLFLLRYMTGSAKSVPVAWKGLVPKALSDGRMPSCVVNFGMESFASKKFYDYSLCYLSQFRNTVISTDNNHGQYDSSMHCYFVSVIRDFLS